MRGGGGGAAGNTLISHLQNCRTTPDRHLCFEYTLSAAFEKSLSRARIR